MCVNSPIYGHSHVQQNFRVLRQAIFDLGHPTQELSQEISGFMCAGHFLVFDGQTLTPISSKKPYEDHGIRY